MKIIHTADWHLGKLVHGIYMTEDQAYILNQLLDVIDEEQPDCLVIAGDLYDRSIPPVEAVELLNEILFQINVVRGIPIVAIAGNHDSGERLSFGSSWYRHHQFYMEGKITEAIFQPVSIKGVNFYLIPYAEPGVVRAFFQDETIHSHEAAMKRIIGKIEENLRPDEVNILVGHAFVAGGKTTDSERALSVGGSGVVSPDLFTPFHYTVLGHLHSPDAIVHEKIAYSGSLLKYSFSECKQRKGVRIIEVDENGDISVRIRSLTPKRDMREISGYLDELLDPQFYQTQNVDDYLKVILADEGAIIDPMSKLRQVYPNVLHLERKIDAIDLEMKQTIRVAKEEKKTELELYRQFYEDMTTSPFIKEKEEIIRKIMDEIKAKEEV